MDEEREVLLRLDESFTLSHSLSFLKALFLLSLLSLIASLYLQQRQRKRKGPLSSPLQPGKAGGGASHNGAKKEAKTRGERRGRRKKVLGQLGRKTPFLEVGRRSERAREVDCVWHQEKKLEKRTLLVFSSILLSSCGHKGPSLFSSRMDSFWRGKSPLYILRYGFSS